MPDTYNDIDSGKLVNKSGLLELSVKIKEYVDNNSSSAEMPFDIIEYQSTFANYSAADLQKIYDYGTGVAGTKPVIIIKDNRLYFFSGHSSSYKNIMFIALQDQVASSFSHSTNPLATIRYSYSGATTIVDQAVLSIYVGDSAIQTSSYYNVSGTAKTLDQELKYIRDNFTKTADLAAVALSNSYDDLDDKPTIPTYTAGTGINIDANNEISCTITDTNTTYTAGTGISITNGVISLDLPVANGVSY